MTMELKATDDPQFFEIHDQDDKVGELYWWEEQPYMGEEVAEEDLAKGWVAKVYNVVGRGRDAETDCYPTAAEAVAEAREMYDEILAKRRAAEQFYRDHPIRIISTPTGGQPRK